MATSFDATARINLDIKSFAQGAQAVTKAGGQMEKIFSNLSQVLSRVDHVEAGLAAKLRASVSAYNAALSVVRNFAQASAQLAKAEQNQANVTKTLVSTFGQLKTALGQVDGLSEKEFKRLSRTIQLYERLAKTVLTLANAQKSMSSITQNAIAAEEKANAARKKNEQTAAKLVLEEQKLELQRQKMAQSATRLALEEQKLAAARQKTSQATQAAHQSTVAFSGSSFALRNTVGELEGSFQALFNVLSKIPTALASAAISQEAAFAQVERVVTAAEAASAGLLVRFQQIAQSAPISFEEVARIGQLGAAIGVSSENLGDFTDTIVKFSLTTGVASEEATILLGRIAQMQNVPISEIDQLGSAILALGTASAATDQEILRVNASIATVSNLFGLTAQETAGLSAALATLQVRPELSRGALTRVFNELATSVSEGGTELKKLALVMNLTDTEVSKLFNNPATRGEFLLTFIDGLSRAAVAGGDVQGVLRELGINAVRDIDVFSRLANNVNVVKESFDRANVEFARGTELNRQSRGIYETTSAELQNLSDAFKTLLATLGGPLATAIGGIASGLSEVIEFFAHLGPVVPIVGTLTAVVVAGGAAWALYQFALAKTIQSLIAAKELQDRLKVSSLSAKLALDIYRNGFTQTATAQAVAANSTRALDVEVSALAGSLARSEVGVRAYAAAAASSAAGLNAMSAATVAASRSQQTMFNSSATLQGVLRQLNITNAATALSMTSVSNANRALALTQTQLANVSKVSAGQMGISATAINTMNVATARAVPLLNTMSASMNRAALAGATLGAGLNTVGIAGGKAATAFTRTATATTQASLAARAASFAFGPWGIALTTIGLLMAPLIGDMFNFSTQAEKIADAAFEATGGTTALANAIKADTETYKRTGEAFRLITVETNALSESQKKAAQNAIDEAQERKRAIELTKGSASELKKQAQGHDQGAQAAARYLREMDAADETIRKSTAALKENTVAIHENVRQWLLDTAEAVVQQSKLADGSKISADALDQLAESGLNVGDVLTKSLEDPEGALADIDAVLADVSKTADNFDPGGGMTDYGKQINSTASAAIRLENFLKALREVISSEDSEATKSALAQELLAEALDGTSASAQSLSGNVKLGKESLEDLETTADDAQKSIDDLAAQFEKFGSPLDAFKKAAESAFGDAADAVDKFSLKSKGGLESYLKELEKIAEAQRDWSANLIQISTTLGPDIAEQFRKLGPEAAPAVEELANLSAKELEKLGPRLAEIGANATSDLAASIIANSGKIENATLQTRTVIADVFGNIIDKAKTAEDFADVSTQYQNLVKQLAKSDVQIDITAQDAKALKSLKDISTFVDLVGKKKVSPEVAIDIIKAEGDLKKIQGIIDAAEASGSLDPKGIAALETILFTQQLTQLTTMVDQLEKEKRFDVEGRGSMNDEQYRSKVLQLTEFLASVEGQGLLNPEGDAQLHDKAYRAQMEALANVILGSEQAGKFDVDGNGKLNDKEFKALLEALKRAVADANKGKLNPKGTVTLAGTGNFRGQLNGIVQAAQRAGASIQQTLTRSATVSVGYFYYQKNNPPKVAQVATGGWINGPGGPKSDSIPAMLSNGEFVVNAAAARRFGALLEVINRHGGRGFSGVAQGLLDDAITGGSQQVRLGSNTGNSLINQGVIGQVPPESVAVFSARMAVPEPGPTNVFNINNQYPQAEPTSVTINRSLAYAATIGGV